MAELEFKHNVSQIPATPLPEPVKRSVAAEVSHVPDFQGAVSSYAQNTNWMSAAGSQVAQRASTAIAKELGNDLGKNPQGDIGPAITDFDKTMQESYQTQAQATLGLQANKLINDTNMEMAKAPRITPELIEKANQNVSIGLQSIFKYAPTEIRPHLEYAYGSQQINQIGDLTSRMIREQRQDRKANTAYASDVNAQNAHAFAMKGDFKAADASVEATRKANNADVAAGISDKETAKTNIDTARQSALSGRATYEYEKARAENKGEKYLADLANKKPDYLTDQDYPVVVNNLLTYVNQQNNLRREDANLARAKFNVSLANDPLGITQGQINELKDHLDPLQFEEANLAYIKSIKELQKKNDGVAKALAGYTDINTFPQQTTENKNGAWEQTYKSILQRPENIASGMTEDTAKLYAASAAPVAIPAYTAELKAKLSTPIPENLEAAGQAVNYMASHNMMPKLDGIQPEQFVMAEKYSQLRQVMPPIEAAQKAYEAVYSKSKEQREANKDALAQYYKTAKLKNENIFAVMKRIVQTPDNLKIRNLPGYMKKVNSLFETYFDVTNGDEAMASELTKRTIDSQYGNSSINGEPELFFHPIENIPGIPPDATGAIQADIVDQANLKFQQDKAFFDNGKADFWYEARQRISADEAVTSKKMLDAINENYKKHPVTGEIFDIHNERKNYNNHLAITHVFSKGQPITIVKHNRSGKDEIFEGAVQANPWGVSTGNPAQPISGGYDLQIKTQNGMQAITLFNPLNSSVSYNPRVDYIKKLYLNTQGLSTLQYVLRPSDKDLEKLIASHPEGMKTL